MPPPKKSGDGDSGKGKPGKKPTSKKPAGKKPASKKPPANKAGAGKAKPPADETQEYQLGDDFLADLDEGDEQAEKPVLDVRATGEPPPDDADFSEEPVDDTDEEEEPGELEEIISAETQEWDGIEAAEEEGRRDDDAEKTLVASAGGAVAGAGRKASARITSSFEAVGGTEGFKALVSKARFPLWAKFLTASMVIVLSVGTATAASLLMYIGDIGAKLKLSDEFKGIEDKLSTVDGGAPQTILILGSDKRPEFKGDTFRGLSDTTMLLRVDPDRNAIALFSLPRDLQVNIPGRGVAKLNEAYAYGGPELALETIQALTDSPAAPGGLQVNHLVNVDFEGFARAVNEIDCVYVDVDRRYFHSNDSTGAAEDYEEIDLQPGYQALCGFDALDYARYRHTDNDVVRAARQQDFLREARQKVPPEVIFAQRKELIDIFTEHTTSDIDDAGTMLQLLKLFLEARSAPVQEVHFEGTLGPSFVTTTPAEIDTAVREFLGIEDTPGQRASTAQPEAPVTPEAAPDASGAAAVAPAAPAKGKAKKKGGEEEQEPAGLTETDFGRELAKGMRTRVAKLPILYPTVLETGSEFDQKPRVYKVNGTGDGSPPDGERAAYKWVISRPALGEYYGFMATRWKDPPILENPSEEREIGDRTYKLYYGGDRLRIVAWEDDDGSYWVANTLGQSLTDREMIDIAKGMTELPVTGG